MPKTYTPKQLDRFQQKYNKLSAKESLRPGQQARLERVTNKLSSAGMLPPKIIRQPGSPVIPETPMYTGTGSPPVKPANPGVIIPRPQIDMGFGNGNQNANVSVPGMVTQTPNTQALNTGAPAPTVGMKKGGKVKAKPKASSKPVAKGWGKARGARAAKIY